MSDDNSNQQDQDQGAALERILDVHVEMTVELGRRKLSISEVLSLAPGSVVEFLKPAGDPLDVYVNDQLVARGEAVVMGERYGLRVTEVVSPTDRLRSSGMLESSAG